MNKTYQRPRQYLVFIALYCLALSDSTGATDYPWFARHSGASTKARDTITPWRSVTEILRGGGVKNDDEKESKMESKAQEESEEAPLKNKKAKQKKKNTNKTKSSKKKGRTPKKTDVGQSKKKIEEVLKTDPSQMMGDAIRERADQLLSSPLSSRIGKNPLLDRIDDTFRSVGWALGSSDQLGSLISGEAHPKISPNVKGDASVDLDQQETGEVEASTTPVLVYYFMRSHGGAHAVQSICSLLATLTGIGAILSSLLIPKVRSTSLVVSDATLGLVFRCLLFAMIKHMTGILATGALAARAIPQIGLRNTRSWIHGLVHDPISQYVFYCACVSFWLPTSTASHPRWWQSHALAPLCLVGPVVFREVINTVYVISDILVLWKCTNQDDSKTAVTTVLQRIIQLSASILDAAMSVLFTSKIWRSSDALQRQAILAKLVGRVSLGGEVLVGVLMTADAAALSFFALYKAKDRASFGALFKSCLCTQLYLRFLLVRRRNIARLATQMRGGAARLPMYVLDVLLDPAAAMGLDLNTARTVPASNSTMLWKDRISKNLRM